MAWLPHFGEAPLAFHGPIDYLSALRRQIQANVPPLLPAPEQELVGDLGAAAGRGQVDGSAPLSQARGALEVAVGLALGQESSSKLRQARLCSKASAEAVMRAVQPSPVRVTRPRVLRRRAAPELLCDGLTSSLLHLSHIKRAPEYSRLQVPAVLAAVSTASPAPPGTQVSSRLSC